MNCTATTSRPKAIHLEDYQAPTWLVDHVSLNIDLNPECTIVVATLKLRYATESSTGDQTPLHLYGHELEPVSIACNDRILSSAEFHLDAESLRIEFLPRECTLQITTHINPAANAALEGLYLSSGNFCTQCEPEGFRRITFFPDRPDIMARYTTTLSADKNSFPVLLSNGNLIDTGDLEHGRHYATWEDPFPKPSYLFALVAGKLHCHEQHYTTTSGRDILLQIYVEPRNASKCEFAMQSLIKAMRWDEQRFGLECDLDRYMIVAVDDFNMGAMENKGLNVFNSKYVLARAETATDTDFLNIESVIAHEYFHNWTGNRITCRDWFQLSLKEGLTVFRDQEFSADMNSAAVKRIEDVCLLQNHQFSEDSGPTAHPVRPETYIEINNFYTMTIYHKGAEIIRMLKTMLGWDGFLKGMDLYIERHDGQAVTTDDFVAAMADANAMDLSQFKRWYSQAGTPQVEMKSSCTDGCYHLHLRQSCPATPGQEIKLPFVIPVKVALFDKQGRKCPLDAASATTATQAALRSGQAQTDEMVLLLNQEEQTFTFNNVPADVTPSVLRGFSAPVKLNSDFDAKTLAFQMRYDDDPVNRWHAARTLLLNHITATVSCGSRGELEDDLLQAWRTSLQQSDADPALAALIMAMPSEGYIAEQMESVDPDAIHRVCTATRRSLATALCDAFKACYRRCHDNGPYQLTPEAIGRRSLKNLCLFYLVSLEDREAQEWLWAQYRTGTNMTDVSAALGLLANEDSARREQALQEFYTRWQDDPLVVDKWFALQARADRSDCLEQIKLLMQQECFNLRNPNRVRALIGTFSQANPAHFHAADGSGYSFLRTHIEALDAFNPQIAARLVTPLLRWPRYEEKRGQLMHEALKQLGENKQISADLYEMVSKGLQQSKD